MPDFTIGPDELGQDADALWDDIALELGSCGREVCAGSSAIGPPSDATLRALSRDASTRYPRQASSFGPDTYDALIWSSLP